MNFIALGMACMCIQLRFEVANTCQWNALLCTIHCMILKLSTHDFLFKINTWELHNILIVWKVGAMNLKRSTVYFTQVFIASCHLHLFTLEFVFMYCMSTLEFVFIYCMY